MDAPHHNLSAEQGVLGCLLSDHADVYHDALAAGLKRDWFYDLRHARILQAIQELELSGTPSTLIAVRQSLGDALPNVGGIAYLIDLQNSSPSPSALPLFLDQCRDAFLKRKAATIAAQGLNLAQGTADGENVLRTILERTAEALDDATHRDSDTGNRLCLALTDSLEKRKALADAGKRSGIPTGLRQLDQSTDGLQHGEQFIIGARPGAGKTALGLTLAAEIALRQSVPTLIVSCEMSTAALLTRLCSISTGIPLSALRYGRYNEGEMKRMLAFNSTLAKAPLFIFDAIAGATGGQVAAVIRQHSRRHGVKFALVDYLQKLRPDRRGEKRTYEIGEVSGELRAAAVASGVALVTLAQVNRDPEKGSEPRAPRASDLADSGQIERDADTIGLLHRDRTDPRKAVLTIAKQRDGETGELDLVFNGPLTRFENPSKETPYE